MSERDTEAIKIGTSPGLAFLRFPLRENGLNVSPDPGEPRSGLSFSPPCQRGWPNASHPSPTGRESRIADGLSMVVA